MPLGLDVRRLAAIDMWGSAGVRWRRWVILAEFLVGVFGAGALGIVAISSGDALTVVAGWWLVGVAANYIPLAWHAITLIRPRALDSEVERMDVPAELRHYTAAQLWVLVPSLLVVLAVRQRQGVGR